MSKMDEMNKFIKEQENLPFSCVGERCGTKTDSIMEKAQELNIPWKVVYCQADNGVFDQSHAYAIIDGKKVDVAYDSDTKKILKGLVNREMNGKVIYDEYFSKKNTWKQVLYTIMRQIGESARVLDFSIEKKRIIYIDNENFERKETEEIAQQFGLSCNFRKIDDDIISVSFVQTGKDNTNRNYKDPEEAKLRKWRRKESKRWTDRDNRLRELEKDKDI
jgi:hypothetical protein